jgi:hypothetical protein
MEKIKIAGLSIINRTCLGPFLDLIQPTIYWFGVFLFAFGYKTVSFIAEH